MQVNILNTSNNPLPAYQTSGSAGMDIMAYLPEPIEIKPLQRILIPTGLHIDLPDGYEAQIRPRSGNAIKFGLTLLNSPGTIDSDYRGEIKVIMINLSDQTHTINNGDRIAQMVIAAYQQAQCIEVKSLSSTERGSGGFGSTGQ